jgi:DUF438 domain-containing protein
MSELIDNRAHRIRTLKEVIRHLHEGRAPQEVKGRLAALVRECDASEIAAMEQELMAEGVPASEIMGMCDLHSQVVRDILVERRGAPPPPGHPVDTFRRENEALEGQAQAMREALRALVPEGGDDDVPVDSGLLLQCRRAFAGLMDVEKHYQRKEHLLFPMLERHGITGPSTVMWGKDDEVRALLKELGTALGETDGASGEWRLVTETVAEAALQAMEEMVIKEERILLPMSLQNLTETEWGEVFAQSPQFGYCLVDPREGYTPPAADADVPEAAAAEAARGGVAFAAGDRAVPLAMAGASPPTPGPAGSEAAVTRGRVVLPTGALSLEQLKAIFATLPVDITFVDADDRVRFFSEGKDRIFARPKAILGRLVQHCHPPSSVDVVDRILADFRSGRQKVAEFWIDFKGRFAHIRYFALRDENGEYLGTLEVTQDLTRERSLQGERRLLQYES